MSEELEDMQAPSSPEETPKPRKKKRRGLKAIFWFLGFSIVLFVGLQLYVRYYTNEILGAILKEVILLKTEGLYQLDYEKIRFSFFKRELQFEGLSLERDSLRYEELVKQGSSFKALVKIEIPNLYINTPDLKKLYLDDKLEMEQFRIDQPRVSVTSFPHVPSQSEINDPRQLNDFFYLLSGYLTEFKVQSFEIDDASVAFSSIGISDTLNQFQLNGFSVDIKNFLVDSTNTVESNTPFYVDNISVDIKKNKFTSKDWPIDIEFGKLQLSTERSSFLLDDFRLRSKKKSDKNFIDIVLPQLRLEELRYDSAYFYKVFDVEKLTLYKPIIHYEQRNVRQRKGGDIPLAQKVYGTLSKFFPKFNINEIQLDSAAFDLAIGQGKSADNLNFDNFNLNIERFAFDSLNYAKRSKKFFVDDADFSVNNYSLDLPDGLHTVKVLQMGISTSNKHFYTSNLFIGPRHKTGNANRLKEKNKDRLLSLYFPRIELNGLEIWDITKNKSLISNRLTISRPKLKIDKYKLDAPLPKLPNLPDSIQLKQRSNKHLLLNLDSIILPQLITKPREIIRLTPEQEDSLIFMMDVDSILATIPDTLLPPPYGEPKFRLDSFFYSEPYTLAIAKPVMLPVQENFSKVAVADSTVENISSQVKDEILVNEENETQDTTSILADTDQNQTVISDSSKTVVENSIIAKSLDSLLVQIQDSTLLNIFDGPPVGNVDGDSLLMASIYPAISKVFKLVDLREITIKDADFELNELANDTSSIIKIEQAQIQLNELVLNDSSHLDSSKIVFTSSFEIGANQVSIRQKNKLHQIIVDAPFISSEDSLISANAFRFSPINRNKEFAKKAVENIGSLFNLNLFDIKIEGFGIRDFIYHQEARIDLFQIKRPNFTQFSSPNFTPSAVPDSVLLSLEIDTIKQKATLYKYIRLLEVKNININNGRYALIHLGETTTNYLSGNQLSVCVKDLELDTALIMNEEISLDADDFEVFTKNLQHLLPDQLHQLSVDELGVSKSGSYVFAYNTKLAPNSRFSIPDSTSTYDLDFPILRLDGFDLKSFYLNQEAIVEQVSIWEPKAKLNLFSKNKLDSDDKNSQVQFSLEALPEKLSKSLKKLYVQNLSLEKGRLNLAQHKDGKTSTIATGFVKLGIDNFYVDSATTLTPERFLFADDVSLNIKNYVHYLPDSTYSIRASEVGYSTSTAEFYATYLHYAPDIWANPDFNKKRDDKRELFEIYTPRIALTGIGSHGIYKGDSLGLESVRLEKPKFRVVTYEKEDKASSEPFHVDSLYSKVANVFPDVNIGSMEMDDISIEVTNHGNEESAHLKLKDIHAGFTHFEVDESIAKNDGRFLHADDLYVKLENYHIDLPDQLHTLDMGEIGFSTGNKEIYIDKFKYNTLPKKYEIAEILGNEADWMRFGADRIVFKGLDFDSLVTANKLISNQLDITKLKGYIFRDKRPPFPKNNLPPLPQESIRNANIYLKIDTIFLHKSSLTYEEFAIGGKKPGHIDFLDLNVWGYNLTNDSAAIANNEAFQLYASTEVMGNGHLDAAFNFQLGSETNAFTYQAELQEMDLTRLNPILEHVAFARIDEGKAKKLLVKVKADEEYSDGIIKFYYDDLYVTLINKETQKTGFGLGIASFLANSLVVKSKNPRFLFLKRGKIYFERIEQKSVVNYLVKTLLSGVKHSVGLSYEKPPRHRRKSFFEFWKKQRKGF